MYIQRQQQNSSADNKLKVNTEMFRVQDYHYFIVCLKLLHFCPMAVLHFFHKSSLSANERLAPNFATTRLLILAIFAGSSREGVELAISDLPKK